MKKLVFSLSQVTLVEKRTLKNRLEIEPHIFRKEKRKEKRKEIQIETRAEGQSLREVPPPFLFWVGKGYVGFESPPTHFPKPHHRDVIRKGGVLGKVTRGRAARAAGGTASKEGWKDGQERTKKADRKGV
jgi:hypothetical protein